MPERKSNPRLITPTLLNSYDWLSVAPRSIDQETGERWCDKAEAEFAAQVKREGKWQPNQPQQHGIDFENAVQRYELRRRSDRIQSEGLTDMFKEFCKHVEGGRFQQVAKTVIQVGDTRYLLYGRIDVLLPEHIIDIKTTANYKGPESYRKTWQHRIYSLATGISGFTYLVACLDYDKSRDYGSNRGNAKLVDYKPVDIDMGGMKQQLVNEVSDQIRSMLSYIDDNGLREAYETKFNRS